MALQYPVTHSFQTATPSSSESETPETTTKSQKRARSDLDTTMDDAPVVDSVSTDVHPVAAKRQCPSGLDRLLDNLSLVQKDPIIQLPVPTVAVSTPVSTANTATSSDQPKQVTSTQIWPLSDLDTAMHDAADNTSISAALIAWQRQHGIPIPSDASITKNGANVIARVPATRKDFSMLPKYPKTRPACSTSKICVNFRNPDEHWPCCAVNIYNLGKANWERLRREEMEKTI